MKNPEIYTIDLNFQGIPGAIAVYLIPYKHGAILVETGPSTTLPALEWRLKVHGFTFKDITDVLLTHIHLDHAGAAGWIARQGARIHVHPVGAPHLINPVKLLKSASRIYGDKMDTLWGEFLPVHPGQISTPLDRDVIEIDGIHFKAIDTPGHAEHHFAYLLNNVCFSGDIGGVRLAGLKYLRLPMPPPELQLEKWRSSLKRLQQEEIRWIVPTHFGMYPDPGWHLAAAQKFLDDTVAWIDHIMPGSPSQEELRQEFSNWMAGQYRQQDLDPAYLPAQEIANPSFMSADGLLRYWKKYREEAQG